MTLPPPDVTILEGLPLSVDPTNTNALPPVTCTEKLELLSTMLFRKKPEFCPEVG